MTGRGLTAVCMLWLFWPWAWSDVVTDGSAGPATTLEGPNFTITDALGMRVGNSLLHSFLEFGVAGDETATFLRGDEAITSILARVTGPGVSQIDGILEADTNLWLLNPNGVLMGADAEVNVAGTFRYTGDGAPDGEELAIILGDGSSFGVNTDLSTLVVADPLDFGFLSEVAAPRIVVDDSLTGTQTIITGTDIGGRTEYRVDGDDPAIGVSAGDNLFFSFERFSVFSEEDAVFFSDAALPVENVVARVTGARSFLNGGVSLDGSALESAGLWFVNPAGIVGGAGLELDVAGDLAYGALDHIEFDSGMLLTMDTDVADLGGLGMPAGFNLDEAGQAGDLLFRHVGIAQTSGADGVSLRFAGDRVAFSDSEVLTESQGGVSAADVLVAGNRVEVHRSSILSRTFSDENAGNVTILGGDIDFDGAHVGSRTHGDGDAGSIEIIAEGDFVAEGVTETDGGSRERSNSILTESGEVPNDQVGGIGSITIHAGGDFRAGSLDILAINHSDDAAKGADGPVEIIAGGDIDLDDTQVTSTTRGAADSEDVIMRGQNITLVDSPVSALTADTGNGGNVDIRADENLTMRAERRDAGGADPRLARISATSLGDGSAGDILLVGGEVLIKGGGDPVGAGVDASTFGDGDAGRVRIEGDIIGLVDSARIRSQTFGRGDAGSVELFAKELIYSRGVTEQRNPTFRVPENKINSEAGGRPLGDVGAAGTVTIRSEGDIDFQSMDVNVISRTSNIDKDRPTFVDVSAAGTLRMNDSSFQAITRAVVRGGDITLHGKNLDIIDSTITASTARSGDAGSVTLTADESIVLRTELEGPGTFMRVSSASLRNRRDEGAAGSVLLEAPVIEARDASIVVGTRSLDRRFNDEGEEIVGNITIRGRDKIHLEETVVSASTDGLASAGNVIIDGGVVELIGRHDSTSGDLRGIESLARGAGNAGSIRVEAQTLNLDQGLIEVSTTGSGNAGNIDIEADVISLIDGSEVRSDARFGTGDAGSINILAHDLISSRGTTEQVNPTFRVPENKINSEAGQKPLTDVGAAGNITIRSGGDIDFQSMDVKVISRTSNIDKDRDIFIDVSAADTLQMNDSSVQAITRGVVRGGDIMLDGQNLDIVDSTITASTARIGDAGSITLTADESIVLRTELEGPGTFMRITSSSVRNRRNEGAAGSVLLEAPVIEARDATIGAGTRSLDRRFDENGAEIVGNITIRGHDRVLLEETAVSASTEGLASAGNVVIEGDVVDVIGRLVPTSGDLRGIESLTRGEGNAGNIRVEAQTLNLDQGLIEVSTEGSGDAGNIEIEADVISLIDGSEVRSDARLGTGDAGSIDILAHDLITSRGTTEQVNPTFRVPENKINSEAGQKPLTDVGAAGAVTIRSEGDIDFQSMDVKVISRTSNIDKDRDIFIDVSAAGTLKMNDSSVQAITRAVVRGGDITLHGRNLDIIDSTITASTARIGDAGSVKLTADESIVLRTELEGQGTFMRVSSASLRNRRNEGAAGSVLLEAPVIEARDAAIVAGTKSLDPRFNDQGEEIVGNVTIRGHDRVHLEETVVSASTDGLASAGNVVIEGEVVELIGRHDSTSGDHRGIESLTRGEGNAGNIRVKER